MAMVPAKVKLGDFATTVQVTESEAKRLGLAPAVAAKPEQKSATRGRKPKNKAAEPEHK